MVPGEIFRHDAFYRNSATGAFERKYLLILAQLHGDDIVARLLTSRARGRPELPQCYHGLPYGGFYLGVPGGVLTTKTWIDLRYLDDLDGKAAQTLRERGVLSLVGSVEIGLLLAAMDCVAGADDTTRMQEQAIGDSIAKLHRRYVGLDSQCAIAAPFTSRMLSGMGGLVGRCLRCRGARRNVKHPTGETRCR